jgi:hypothetical protein
MQGAFVASDRGVMHLMSRCHRVSVAQQWSTARRKRNFCCAASTLLEYPARESGKTILLGSIMEATNQVAARK